jgi:hypothetical protein
MYTVKVSYEYGFLCEGHCKDSLTMQCQVGVLGILKLFSDS